MPDNGLLLTRSVPQYAFQRTTVYFPSSDTDVPVPHTLAPTDPESVEYYVVRLNGPAVIYDDQSETRTAWRTNCLYLRSSVKDTVADLILILPSPEKPRRPLMRDADASAGKPVIYLGGSRHHGVQVPA